MNPNDPNVLMLEMVAQHLGDELREQLVFVGGAVAGLLITDPAMPAIRRWYFKVVSERMVYTIAG